MGNNVLKILKPYFKKGILALTLKSTEAIIDLILPLIMADIIDNGVMKQNIHYIIYKGLLMILVATIGYTSAIACNYYSVQASQGFGKDLREKIFIKIQNFNFKQLNKFTQASLITRVTQDVTQIVMTSYMCMRMVVKGIVTGIGAIIMSLIINPSLSTILFIIVPITVYLTYFYMKQSIPLYTELQKRLDRLTQIIRENLVGIRVIKAFVREDIEKEKFQTKNTSFAEKNIESQNLIDSRSPFIVLLLNIGISAILWFGGEKVNVGKIKIGEIVALINYMTMILFSLNALSFLFSLLSKTIVSYERINEVLGEKIENQSEDILDSSNSKIAIEFKNVYFSYGENSPWVLENINFVINKGDTVAIIGGVGSGKSTLINLIPRFYDVSSGEILIDGFNVKNYSLKNLRQKIGIVMQKTFLFSQSIENNIKWGKSLANQNEIEKVIEMAQGNEFIKNLPDKYKTMVAKGGMNFSGGQKQRLSIARTLIKNSEILIFDDSFSSLDFITESKLRKEILNLKGDKTIIIISQRISSIKKADNIIVLDNGKISNVGPHSELLKKSEIYREICESQECSVGGRDL
ncbi:ABC transporter ATP-binding protein [Candidatus Cetobacterium colombiensis]|uniref:ABC transporter ATP-binding protein n=1 Tax=Candidatus Cetobacterium colombiensis TaxID=3073100 RepID=A0ABU4W810_9FUSO|nr:ABC transporter ATP-binding protein [Candidatus Cetobacterium colombiensis]MDX8335653.1 ABC transporter ATP-binding protein [Candidatus Cetobacterium colombiensis]